MFENLTKDIVKHRSQLTDSDWDELKFDIYEPEIHSITSTKTVVRYKLSKGPKDRFVNSTRTNGIVASIQQTEAYDKTLQFLIDHSCRSTSPKEFSVYDLKRFISNILNQRSSEERSIQNAVSDALCLPVSWKCKAYLVGLSPEGDEMKSSDMIMRIPKNDDFPRKGGEYSYGEWFPPPHTHDAEYHTIVEWIEKGVAKGPESYDKIRSSILDKIRFLRLVKTGSWILTGWKAHSDWIFEISHHTDELGIKNVLQQRMKDKNIHEFFFHYFTEEDANRYEKLHTIKNSLSTKSHGFKALQRSIEFFDEACQRHSIEAVVFSTIGLECLYSKDETEQQFKVATRVAIMLQSEEYPREAIFDDIVEAYKIRNKFVHGSETLTEKAMKVVERMTEYLRRSILIWMQSDCLSKSKMEKMQEALLRSSMNEGILEKVQMKIEHAIL